MVFNTFQIKHVHVINYEIKHINKNTSYITWSLNHSSPHTKKSVRETSTQCIMQTHIIMCTFSKLLKIWFVCVPKFTAIHNGPQCGYDLNFFLSMLFSYNNNQFGVYIQFSLLYSSRKNFNFKIRYWMFLIYAYLSNNQLNQLQFILIVISKLLHLSGDLKWIPNTCVFFAKWVVFSRLFACYHSYFNNNNIGHTCCMLLFFKLIFISLEKNL